MTKKTTPLDKDEICDMEDPIRRPIFLTISALFSLAVFGLSLFFSYEINKSQGFTLMGLGIFHVVIRIYGYSIAAFFGFIAFLRWEKPLILSVLSFTLPLLYLYIIFH
ncbi:hypothetical protein [Ereboglobus luteus]|uniref:hypothetical protein n=1 Tax=Ereboglobus luteus TaxID=1796921 RepID=UPI0012600D24|nr:hypothetical protein [Ereboglobus luteus]